MRALRVRAREGARDFMEIELAACKALAYSGARTCTRIKTPCTFTISQE